MAPKPKAKGKLIIQKSDSKRIPSRLLVNKARTSKTKIADIPGVQLSLISTKLAEAMVATPDILESVVQSQTDQRTKLKSDSKYRTVAESSKKSFTNSSGKTKLVCVAVPLQTVAYPTILSQARPRRVVIRELVDTIYFELDVKHSLYVPKSKGKGKMGEDEEFRLKKKYCADTY